MTRDLFRLPAICNLLTTDCNEIEVLIDAKDLPKDCRTAGDRARAVGRLGREHMLRSLRTSNWDFRESLFKNVLKIHFR